MEKLLERFQNYIREHELVAPAERILLTVSGGVDSMVMLSLFARSGYTIGVAHCNFQLRGEESDEDEVLVQNEAARYGVPFYNMRFDTKAEMERTGESVQMAARRLRYDWFNALCSEQDYDVIAIAHHADDSIETFFINLLRGTGLRGLTGIHAVNGRIIRPLLFASRRDILDYAHAEQVPFREDSSNRSTKYLRNKVRLGLIPRIREINPKFTEQMCSNIERLTDAQLFISRGMERIRALAVEHRDGFDVVDPEKIDPDFPVDFVIYELLNAYGFKGDVIDSLCRAMRHDATGKRFYAKERVAYIDRGKIIVAPIEESDACAVELQEEMTKLYCGNSVLYLERLDIDDIDTFSLPENVALLDRDKLNFPLVVRRWNDGDSFVPFGMTGCKKVSDFLIDHKVSLAEKQRQFVIVNGDGGENAGQIVWLVGRRIDDRFRLGTKTENVLKITREVL